MPFWMALALRLLLAISCRLLLLLLWLLLPWFQVKTFHPTATIALYLLQPRVCVFGTHTALIRW